MTLIDVLTYTAAFFVGVLLAWVSMKLYKEFKK